MPFVRRATLVIATAAITLVPSLAHATNQSTVSGNGTTGCALTWNAETQMNPAGIPGYDHDLAGNPVDYSNGGYIREVSPHFGDPGLMEIQHWEDPGSTNWRIPIATDHTILGATITVTLPADATYTAGTTSFDYVMDKRTDPAWKTRWGITNTLPTPVVTGNVVTVHLGDIPAGSHYAALMVNGRVPAQDNTNHTLDAVATLTGTYVQGDGCAATTPPRPVVDPEAGCHEQLLGRTLRPLGASDITSRQKWGDGGETNADGWANTFRLYGATDRDLTNVTYTATAAQGFTFTPNSTATVVTGQPVGLGQLYANGFTAPVTGIAPPVISADGRTVTLTIDHMPAHSAFAFNVGWTGDGSGRQLVVDHVMDGTLTGCTMPSSALVTTTSDGPPRCATHDVVVTSTTTSTPSTWRPETGEWVAGTPLVATTTSTRPLTASEAAACTPAPIPTPAPTPTPTSHPAPSPAPTLTTPHPPVTMRTYVAQVDTYRWTRSLADGRRIAAFDDDGRLGYREDSYLWMTAAAKAHTSYAHQFVAFRAPVGATAAQLVRAYDAAAPAALRTRTTTRLAAVGASGSVTDVWLLGTAATAAQPWGASKRVVQTYLGRR